MRGIRELGFRNQFSFHQRISQRSCFLQSGKLRYERRVFPPFLSRLWISKGNFINNDCCQEAVPFIPSFPPFGRQPLVRPFEIVLRRSRGEPRTGAGR